MPGKSHVTTPNNQKADLTVEWHERTVNVAIDPKKFTIAVPAGLPTCGQAPAAGSAAPVPPAAPVPAAKK